MSEIIRYERAQASLEQGLVKLARRLKDFDVSTEGAEFEISRIASQCQKARDLAKDRRDRELAPFVPKVKSIRARWKPIVDGFDLVFKKSKDLGQDILRSRRAEQERLRKEAEQKLLAAQRAEAKAKSKKALAKIQETAKDLKEKVEALPPEGAPLGVKTDETTLYARKAWKWETTDINKVPDTYVKRYTDTPKVDLAVKNGKRNIPGIKIWEEEEMVSRRNV